MTTSTLRPPSSAASRDLRSQDAADVPERGVASAPRPPARTVGGWLADIAIGAVSVTLGCLYIATYAVVGIVRTAAHGLSGRR